MKGLITLDIDGTVAEPSQPMTQEVADFLRTLSKEGWVVMFITGRTLHWAAQLLEILRFPFFLAVQNGAIILEMPSQQIIGSKYLDKSILPAMEQICENKASGFVIYAGCEYEDACYFRPHSFSPDLLEYVRDRSAVFKENWHEVASFDHQIPDQFASVKCFGFYEDAMEIAQQIENRLGLHVPLIRDPFSKSYYVAQATHPEVNKGQALRDLVQKLGIQGKIIAAGDDFNDQSMLEAADIKVVMATAPKVMLAQADIIAPSAAEKGIIAGLTQAVMQR